MIISRIALKIKLQSDPNLILKPLSRVQSLKFLYKAVDISFLINNKTVLHNVNLQINRGDFITVIGPNGGGKTTLIKIIAGILRPSKGSIKAIKSIKIGYVPQVLTKSSLTSIKVRNFLKDSESNCEAQDPPFIHEIMESPLERLSVGQLQQVFFAKCLLAKPDLMILDEPTSGLDLKAKNNFYQIVIEALNNSNCGVIMTSHDLHFISSYTTKVVCLNKGICCQGGVTEVISHPIFSELFGKENVNLYKHSHD